MGVQARGHQKRFTFPSIAPGASRNLRCHRRRQSPLYCIAGSVRLEEKRTKQPWPSKTKWTFHDSTKSTLLPLPSISQRSKCPRYVKSVGKELQRVCRRHQEVSRGVQAADDHPWIRITGVRRARERAVKYEVLVYRSAGTRRGFDMRFAAFRLTWLG